MASADCKGPSDAYRKAYNCERMKGSSVSVQAQKLLANPNIALMIDRLKKRSEDQFIYSQAEHLRKLQELRDLALSRNNILAAIKAEELVGKSLQYYTEKKEVKHEGGLTITWDVADD
jgi:hypothetical protein